MNQLSRKQSLTDLLYALTHSKTQLPSNLQTFYKTFGITPREFWKTCFRHFGL
jgi:hypothetical protein